MKIVNLFLVACLAFQSSEFINSFSRAPSRRLSSWSVQRLASRVSSNGLSSLTMVATDAPPTKVDEYAMSGMFTNSSPDTKRVIPMNTDGKVKFKIVYVVLESQYQSALTKACNAINNGKENVAVEAVGYLLEELRNPKILEQFKDDVASANIFIGSLIFMQELADKVCSICISGAFTACC